MDHYKFYIENKIFMTFYFRNTKGSNKSKNYIYLILLIVYKPYMWQIYNIILYVYYYICYLYIISKSIYYFLYTTFKLWYSTLFNIVNKIK